MDSDLPEPALSPDDVPERVELDGLVVRRLLLDDLDTRYRAILASHDHLRPWMAWAAEPPTEQEHRERFQRAVLWPSGRTYHFGIFDEQGAALFGMAAVHDRLGPGAVEIGYWCHIDHVGRGVITRSVGELTRILLRLPQVDQVEIRCDEANVRSAAVPERLGYRLDRFEDREVRAPAESGRDMVWIKE